MDQENRRETDLQGSVEARYVAFLETITTLRPKLHRYCSRMTGSVMDGEDVVQEALFQAYRTLDSFDDSRPLAPWLFRIAHNRCIDFLRRREVRANAEAAVEEPDPVMPAEPSGPALGRALGVFGLLDLTPKGRDEAGLPFPMAWVRHHDRYEGSARPVKAAETSAHACCSAGEHR